MTYLLDIIPLLLLFVIFFMAFSFIETVIMLAIKYYIKKYWVVFVDKLMRGIIFHKNMIRIMAVGSLALLASILILLTPLFDIFVGDENVIKFLGYILIVEMILIYFFANREVSETVIEKRIHLYAFSFFSIIAFTAIMLMANQSYADYEKSINKSFVYPIIRHIEKDYEQRVEDRLMLVIRDQIKDGECELVDYATNEAEPGLIQFAYVRDDLPLAEKGYVTGIAAQKGELLNGMLCTHETKFMFTPDGKWYQVLQQKSD